MAKRAFLIVLDSVGIGAMPDAANWGDEGSNTLAAICKHSAFNCPNLTKFGLFNIDGVQGEKVNSPRTCYARMQESSNGKDTTIATTSFSLFLSPLPVLLFLLISSFSLSISQRIGQHTLKS